MPLERTHEEELAMKISPRNYSTVLGTIYTLRKRSLGADYVVTSNTVIPTYAGYVGQGASTYALFSSLSPSPCAKGAAITLTGKASYQLIGNSTEILPSKKITAQIDIGRTGSSFPSYQIDAIGSDIQADGTFTITIPGSLTERLSSGTHYVYIDAHSPNNRPVRLATGTENNVRSFIIS